ncbi:tyrosine-type recombinase/integrase [Staphylococcus agnetis]|uniref:tyrosine-type recombinase/integrase n=1 Tax=Staphylococcus agnetis TaxID=985762 RepID=UPI001F0FB957|nr:site-specific integrase [Staphylococcus agnetis]
MVTGARFSEVQKLKYQDFNLSDETVHIRGTKLKMQIASLKLLKKILNMLEGFKQLPNNIQGNIFTTGANLITHNAVTKVLQRFCLDNKLGNYTLHSLRHTHCSMLIHNGISIYYISKRLGHADITTTLSIYSHLLEETRSVEENKTLEALRSM